MGRQVRKAGRVPTAAAAETRQKDKEQKDEGQITEEKQGGAEVVQLGFLPADPEDPRLRPEGAVCKEDGKLNVDAYADLHAAYKGEPEPEKHPDPAHPGVRKGELIPKGLRIWDDVSAGNMTKDGAGWIAMYSTRARGRPEKTEKWFNIRTCGSWRLAFLLARLQRDLWERRGAAATAAAATAGDHAMPGAAGAGAVPAAAGSEPAAATPKGKKRRSTAGLEETARKQPRRPGEESQPGQAHASVAAAVSEAGKEHAPALTPAQRRLEEMRARILAKQAAGQSEGQ